MTKQEIIKPDTQAQGIAGALVSAQKTMGKALKQSSNPHFKSKYADLGSVVDACMGSLNDAGIAVIQPTGEDEHGRYVETRLIHAVSGDTLSCRVPLIVSKNDMQGYGSAVTYARRYGLMAMTGIAPEDDDGNAAAKAPPMIEVNRTVSAEQFQILRALIQETDTDEAKFHMAHGHPDPENADLHQFPAAKFEVAKGQLERKKAAQEGAE